MCFYSTRLRAQILCRQLFQDKQDKWKRGEEEACGGGAGSMSAVLHEEPWERHSVRQIIGAWISKKARAGWMMDGNGEEKTRKRCESAPRWRKGVRKAMKRLEEWRWWKPKSGDLHVRSVCQKRSVWGKNFTGSRLYKQLFLATYSTKKKEVEALKVALIQILK